MNSSVWAVWAAQAVRKRKWILVFLSNFWGWFFQLFMGKKNLNFLKKYFNNRTKKLQKKSFYIFVWIFFCPNKVEKIGYHSRFNPKCNGERGYTDSLYITLGVVVAYDSRQTCGQFQYYAEPCAQMKSETFFSFPL